MWKTVNKNTESRTSLLYYDQKLDAFSLEKQEKKVTEDVVQQIH